MYILIIWTKTRRSSIRPKLNEMELVAKISASCPFLEISKICEAVATIRHRTFPRASVLKFFLSLSRLTFVDNVGHTH
jgi:hypothetical protein